MTSVSRDERAETTDLIVLSQDEYTDLRTSLKDAGLDLCYTAQSVRLSWRHWTPELMRQQAFVQEIAQRRPTDSTFRIASVAVVKPGNWLFPAQLSVTFHAARDTDDEAVQHYLATHAVGAIDGEALEAEAETEAHATPATYVGVALVLALVTIIEVSAFYLPDDLRPPRWALMVVLMLLSAFKFGVVASFFMHLRYDHRLLAGCFAGGIIVAASTLLALVMLFRDTSNFQVQAAEARAGAPVVEASHSAPLNAGDAEAGKLAFQKFGCNGCHTISEIPSARGNVGPVLDGLTQRAGNRISGMSSQDYVRQSIENPAAYVVKGYLNLMPPLRPNMTEQEYQDILALMDTL